jgi:cell division protease FtsH
VVLEMPDLTARRDIIKIHARGKPFDQTVDWERVARATVGFSGAELENMLNEAAIKAARENKTKIGMVDIDEASLKVKLGSEKRREQTDEDKLMTAYHEAGHAIVNHVEELDSVTRISIVSRGMALGFTLVPPKRDMIHQTKSKLIKQMAMAMGGRAAEELVFGDITTGASSDISHVTRIARNMVTEWGMSELGPINLGPEIDTTEYGKGWIEPTKISDTMASRVDEEIKKLVNTALEKAREILSKNRKKLDEIAKVLVVKETIGEDEFEAMMNPALAKA